MKIELLGSTRSCRPHRQPKLSQLGGKRTVVGSEAAATRLGIVPRRRLELPSYEAVLQALKKGYGIAAISRFVIAGALRSGSLTVVTVRGWRVSSTISVLRVRDAVLTPSSDQFQSFVRKRFSEISRVASLERQGL